MLSTMEGNADPGSADADPARPRPPWASERLALAGLLVVAALGYGLGIRTALLSDAWSLVVSADFATLQKALAEYLPHPAVWYRPTTDLAYWLFSHAFGVAPLPFHVLALAVWLLTIALVHQLALRLTGRPWAALAAAAVFATSIHAHEALWDVAALHVTLIAPVLLGTVLAASTGHRRLVLVLTVVALTIDEAGLLCLPLVLVWDALAEPGAGETRRAVLIRALRLAWPLVVVAGLYVAARLATGGFHAESITHAVDVCRTPTCLAAAAVQYANRLAVRGDPLLEQLAAHSRLIFGLLAGGIAAVALILRPWRWRPLRPLLFSIAWIAIATAFFVLALWPYIADRFMYVPDIGVALLAAALVAGAQGAARSWPGWRRVLAGLLAVLGAAWIVTGAFTFFDRAGRWLDAGDQGTAVLQGVEPYLRSAPPRSVIVVLGAPDQAARQVPPGGTGPFVFHNGLPLACVWISGRTDLTIVTDLVDVPAGAPATYLQVTGRQVTQLPGPPPG